MSEPYPHPPYGTGDTSYRAAGGVDGLRRLTHAFYRFMGELPQSQKIFAMHRDIRTSDEKLALFLCGWLGGPKLFSQSFGPIHIPKFHAHMKIDTPERDAWLLCMDRAVAEQPWADSFREYFRRQIRVPANRVHQVSVARRAK